MATLHSSRSDARTGLLHGTLDMLIRRTTSSFASNPDGLKLVNAIGRVMNPALAPGTQE
jgi:hypothetical protein